jgi:hypothetical protein
MRRAAMADSDRVEVRSPSRRSQKRTRLAGNIRLLVDTPSGLVTLSGQIIDLSEGGCALRLHRRVDSELVGRVHVEVARTALWLPVVIRWAREQSPGWIVGCEFDRPTEEKQRAIRALLLERRRMTA